MQIILSECVWVKCVHGFHQSINIYSFEDELCARYWINVGVTAASKTDSYRACIPLEMGWGEIFRQKNK